jgi:hypothetical protein
MFRVWYLRGPEGSGKTSFCASLGSEEEIQRVWGNGAFSLSPRAQLVIFDLHGTGIEDFQMVQLKLEEAKALVLVVGRTHDDCERLFPHVKGEREFEFEAYGTAELQEILRHYELGEDKFMLREAVAISVAQLHGGDARRALRLFRWAEEHVWAPEGDGALVKWAVEHLSAHENEEELVEWAVSQDAALFGGLRGGVFFGRAEQLPTLVSSAVWAVGIEEVEQAWGAGVALCHVAERVELDSVEIVGALGTINGALEALRKATTSGDAEVFAVAARDARSEFEALSELANRLHDTEVLLGEVIEVCDEKSRPLRCLYEPCERRKPAALLEHLLRSGKGRVADHYAAQATLE